MTLRLECVSKAYGDVLALTELELTVEDGELLAVVGPSGCGKSTALRVLAGLETPSSGRVLIDDRDVTRVPPYRRDLAMVFQDLALFPHLTARQNIAFGPRVRREAAEEAARRTASAAERLGIDRLLDRYPDQLSGGQRQRVALARAMVRQPKAYLMDEPLSDLDAQLRSTARTEIVELHRSIGATTVYVTHDQAEAMTMGDRIAVMAEGRLQQVGTPAQVYDKPANVFVAAFMGSPSMNLVPGGGVLDGEPGTVVGVRPEDLHLEPGADGRGGHVRIDAEVSVVESLGSETVLLVRSSDGTRLAVRTVPRSPYRSGDAVRLYVEPSRLHVFDEGSGCRR